MKRPQFNAGEPMRASDMKRIAAEVRRVRIRQNVLIGVCIAMLPISCLVGLLVTGDMIPFDIR